MLAVAPAVAPAVAVPAEVLYAFVLVPSLFGAFQGALRGFQHMVSLGDPLEPPDGAFEHLMASQGAREEANQK